MIRVVGPKLSPWLAYDLSGKQYVVEVLRVGTAWGRAFPNLADKRSSYSPRCARADAAVDCIHNKGTDGSVFHFRSLAQGRI